MRSTFPRATALAIVIGVAAVVGGCPGKTPSPDSGSCGPGNVPDFQPCKTSCDCQQGSSCTPGGTCCFGAGTGALGDLCATDCDCASLACDSQSFTCSSPSGVDAGDGGGDAGIAMDGGNTTDGGNGTDGGNTTDGGTATCTTTFLGRNNSAVLSGGSLGSGIESTSLLRKSIPVVVSGPTNGFSVPATAYLTRTASNTQTAYLAIPVQNTLTQSYCFVQVGQLAWLGADGGQLTSGTTYAYGSTGVIKSISALTSSCLGPGETGYVYGIQSPGPDGGPASYDATASILLSGINSSTSGTQLGNPAAIMIPQSYTATTNSKFTASFLNTGCDAGTVSSFTRWILLDSTSAPLGWGFANPASTNVPIAPQGMSTVTGDIFYNGAGNRLHLQLDISGSSTCCSPSYRMTDREVLDALNQQTAELAAQL